MKRTRSLMKPKLTPSMKAPLPAAVIAEKAAEQPTKPPEEVQPQPETEHPSEKQDPPVESVAKSGGRISGIRRAKPVIPSKPARAAVVVREKSPEKRIANDVVTAAEPSPKDDSRISETPATPAASEEPPLQEPSEKEDSLASEVIDAPECQPKKRTERKAARKANEFREMLIASRRKFAKVKNPVDTSKLTMLDLIYYNPPGEPMRKKRSETPKEVEDVQQSLEPELEDETNMSTLDDSPKAEEDECVGPRVIVGPDGSIQIDEASLVIRRPNPEANKHKLKITVEEAGKARYDSFKTKRMKKCTWTATETSKFYKALSICGTDFTLMTQFFPSRSRQDLKNKFKREEKTNSTLIDKAIHHPTQFEYTEMELEDIAKDDLPTSSKKQRASTVKRKRRAKDSPKIDEEPDEGGENQSGDEVGFRNGVIKDTTERPRRQKNRVDYNELNDGLPREPSETPEKVEENTAAGNYLHLDENGEAAPQAPAPSLESPAKEPRLPSLPALPAGLAEVNKSTPEEVTPPPPSKSPPISDHSESEKPTEPSASQPVNPPQPPKPPLAPSMKPKIVFKSRIKSKAKPSVETSCKVPTGDVPATDKSQTPTEDPTPADNVEADLERILGEGSAPTDNSDKSAPPDLPKAKVILPVRTFTSRVVRPIGVVPRKDPQPPDKSGL